MEKKMKDNVTEKFMLSESSQGQSLPRRGFKAYLQRKVATHEMSHCLSAIDRGIPFTTVTIKPGSGDLGHVALSKKASVFSPSKMTPAAARTFVKNHSVTALAGNAGTLRFMGKSEWESGASADLEVARSLILAVAESTGVGEAMMAAYWKQAQDIVNRDWELIRILAESLMQHQTMSDEQVRREIAEAKRRP
jgi:ATP-dependent Zn protease